MAARTDAQAPASSSAGSSEDEADTSQRAKPLLSKRTLKSRGYKDWWRDKLSNKVLASQRAQTQGQGDGSRSGIRFKSGANVTLEDIKSTKEEVEADRPPPDAFLRLAQSDLPSDTLVGEPDPSLYQTGVTPRDLSPSEVESEIAKGNIFSLGDFRRQLKNAYNWELKAAAKMTLLDVLKNKIWMELADGSNISLWNLYNYVHNNPELKALADRNMSIETSQPAVNGDSSGLVFPWRTNPGATQLQLSPAMERKLPWGFVASGEVWSRRPTRWLKNLDGRKDFDYALYVHEAKAHEALRDDYADEDPNKVLSNTGYYEAIKKAAPSMYATFLFTTARELPLHPLRTEWEQRLGQILTSQQENGPVTTPEQTHNGLKMLSDLFDGQRLREQTRMMDISGQSLRKGCSVLMTTGPEGQIMVQAISPGTLRDREDYLLGTVRDKPLCNALMDMFLGTDSIDEGFVQRAGYKMLLYANGFTTHNVKGNRNQTRKFGDSPYVVEVFRSRPTLFALPRVGESRQPMVLGNIRKLTSFKSLHEAFENALAAARRVPIMEDAPARRSTQQQIALSSLQQNLLSLGIDLNELDLSSSDDIVEHGQPLEMNDR